MQEKDIIQARALLKNKTELNFTLRNIKNQEDVRISVGATSTVIREGVLREMLDKEIAYTNRKLKTLGATELT